LISYPLSVSWALTFFHSATFDRALREVVESGKEEVLEIHGDGDQFTGVERYRARARELRQLGASASSAEGGEEGQEVRNRWKSVEVDGADHFWSEREGKERLLHEVREWLRR
jgi:uncharacterized protein